ncbi:hypothetical protein RND81_03G235500 [Saponaria officinalis]|uniref:YbaK/aminoacyl-tRNA synthetase-associated domain-containing protein n=1 Tax=Saponaria officinalis TaxID=3572 RepID=A0AAW1MAW7_SAPOF
MGYSKEQLITRLKELEIEFERYDHPVVLTVEEALKYVGNVDGAFCKNLFLKDKKNRFYIVSALSETKVDMKVLSQRLGLGKGGIRMAPEEALGEVLQVPLGCVTPFALVNESARHVSLLLDQGLKSQNRILFHPLSNDVSLALSTVGLDKFLNSIGRNSAYVDLEANPPVGKDQPPDLAIFVPTGAVANTEPETAPGPTAVPVQIRNSDSTAVGGKTAKQPVEAKTVNKKKSENVKAVESKSSKSISCSNPQTFVEEILDKTSNLILSEITEATIKEHGNELGTVASDNVRKRLVLELNNLAMIFKNSAYTEGFYAGTRHQPSQL